MFKLLIHFGQFLVVEEAINDSDEARVLLNDELSPLAGLLGSLAEYSLKGGEPLSILIVVGLIEVLGGLFLPTSFNVEVEDQHEIVVEVFGEFESLLEFVGLRLEGGVRRAIRFGGRNRGGGDFAVLLPIRGRF